MFGTILNSFAEFQSTLPVGGATLPVGRYSKVSPDFNPRSPWGERQSASLTKRYCNDFNPRSPWGERRLDFYKPVFANIGFQSTLPVGGATLKPITRDLSDEFQSTLPVGGATNALHKQYVPRIISIHAPRGGSDLTSLQLLSRLDDFNPRSPWGERLPIHLFPFLAIRFQSTLPVGGATLLTGSKAPPLTISIHAPRGGSDLQAAQQSRRQRISIHAPRGGSDNQTCAAF